MLARIEATQRRHDNRFVEIGEDVAALDTKVTTLDSKVTTLDAKLDRVIGLLGG